MIWVWKRGPNSLETHLIHLAAHKNYKSSAGSKETANIENSFVSHEYLKIHVVNSIYFMFPFQLF